MRLRLSDLLSEGLAMRNCSRRTRNWCELQHGQRVQQFIRASPILQGLMKEPRVQDRAKDIERVLQLLFLGDQRREISLQHLCNMGRIVLHHGSHVPNRMSPKRESNAGFQEESLLFGVGVSRELWWALQIREYIQPRNIEGDEKGGAASSGGLLTHGGGIG